MPQLRRNEPIRAWEAGDTVQGFVLVTKKEVRQDRNGRSYLDVEVADSTGRMISKVWADSAALGASWEAHDFVAIRGLVKNYRDQLQLSIDDCRVAGDEDRRYGFDPSLLVPSTREDIADLWRRLDRALATIRRPELQRLARHALEVYGARLREHPAAKTIHHAYRGGLLEHVTSMAELAVKVCSHYRQADADLVLVGVLFHDLGKTRELGAMPANDYTLEGRLIGHVVIGRDLLRDACRELGDIPPDVQMHLEHLVLSHQGKLEYASPVEPMTAEALVLSFIDDLDSKLNQLVGAAEEGPGLRWVKGLGRYVYLGDGSNPTPERVEAEAAEDCEEVEVSDGGAAKVSVTVERTVAIEARGTPGGGSPAGTGDDPAPDPGPPSVRTLFD
ncbi:MAG TPA: HD domain-containing protein [Thermoanaerobaculia bacterium]|nr:HD domain-containing protein [Thermoanaerobaculia bacterium]